MAHPYKASKAWHNSVELAADVEHLILRLTDNGERALARRIRQTSVSTHLWLADSHKHEHDVDRSACYQKAREAVEQLYVDLDLAYSFHYIDSTLHEQLLSRTIGIYRLLSQLIQTTGKTITTS